MSLSIEILKKELKENQIALDKSFDMFKKGIIDFDLHNTHKTNLIPKINQLRFDIERLKVPMY